MEGASGRSSSSSDSATETATLSAVRNEVVTAGAPVLEGVCHCGQSRWALLKEPASATACNCTLCRRYGVLWAYGYEGECVQVSGPLTSFTRVGKLDPALAILFCPTCGCVVSWRGLRLEEDGRRRVAVNLRLAEPETIAALPLDHFDGLDTFDDLPPDGKCIRDVWF